MPLLFERLEVLESQVELLRRATDERGLITALRTRRDQLCDVSKFLTNQLEALERMQRLGARVQARPRLSSALREKPRTMRERVTKSLDDVARDQQWDSTLLTPLRSFGEKVEICARDAWQSLVDERVPSIKDEVLTQLQRIGLGREVREVSVARDRIKHLRARMPDNDAAVVEVDACGKAIEHALLTLKNVPLAVQSFLAKAAAQNANLDDLTTEVHGWLQEKDMLKLITLGLR